jgi:CBS domain-containing protein
MNLIKKMKEFLGKKEKKKYVKKERKKKKVVKEKEKKQRTEIKIKPVRVKDVMTKNVKFLKENDTLKDAVELFSKNKISGAPVVSKNKPVGVISESDILKIVGEDNILNIKDVEILKTTKVKDVMNKPIVVKHEDTLEYVINLMNKHDINRLPVINEKGKLVGIVARADVMKGMMEILFFNEMKKETFGSVIETDIDKLLHELEAGPLTIQEIAKRINMNESQVEDWIKILEDHGLVKIDYPPIGKPIVRRTE